MRSFMRLVVAVLAAAVAVIVTVNAARAENVNAPRTAAGKTAPAYVAPFGRSLPRARVESILMHPRGAVAGTKRGTGWLLHYGTDQDNCGRADATSGLRVMCVTW